MLKFWHAVQAGINRLHISVIVSLQWWSSVWQYWGRSIHWLNTCVCCWLWAVLLFFSINPTRALLLVMTIFLALERFCWWANTYSVHFTYLSSYAAHLLASPSCPHGCFDFPITFISRLGVVFCCIIAGLSDIGRFDWCGPGPHEGSLPDGCEPHDAEHQHVVQSGAGTRWVSHLIEYVSGACRLSFQLKIHPAITLICSPAAREETLMSKLTLVWFSTANTGEYMVSKLSLWIII